MIISPRSWAFRYALKTILCASSLGALAESAIVHAAADDAVRIDIPAGRLTDALSALSRQTGISVGMSGRLPDVAVPAISGRMRPAKALERLLRNSDVRAIATGPGSFRLERQSQPVVRPEQPEVETAPDIIVTGGKREQTLALFPVSISVVSLVDNPFVQPLGGSHAVAGAVDGLTLTNLGPGRNRQFIRGVADSPFSGTSQSTVAIQIDDARVGYDAPDPDLRLVDVERVEILKGPQGPLYGSGALGGVYHIVTRRPNLSAFAASGEIHASTVASGGEGVGGEAMVNIPLVTDTLGLRATAYRDFEPGWIDNDDGRQDSNDSHVRGGRMALRWRPSEAWTVDLLGAVQLINQDDSQYVTRSAEALHRASQFPEPSDNDFRLAALTVTGRIGGMDFVSATSVTDQQIGNTLDASLSASAFGLTGPLRYDEERTYTVLNQEVRLSQTRTTGLSWVAGLSWISAETNFDGTLQPTSGGATVKVVGTHQEISELAAFAEMSIPLDESWRITGGARLFRSIAHNERDDSELTLSDRQIKIGVTPSLSLSWAPSADRFWYLRFATAIRPGGLSASGAAEDERFASDELMNLDFGWRLGSPGRALSAEGAIYLTHWDHIQSDYLLGNGLIGTHNAGNGRIYGVENRLRWKPTPVWSIEAGATLQRARLVRTFDPAISDPHRRLPVVPDYSLRLEVTRRIELAGWHADIAARINHIGPAHLSFDAGLDRDMGEYSTVASTAVLSNGRWSIGVYVDNLLNAHGDSFGLGNPFSLRSGSQYTPLRPRTMTLSVRTGW